MSATAPGASPPSIGPGTRLGPYEILGALGAGGMGEVFRARDLRLGREVAIKLLPPAMAAHPARVRRFEQEARACSALNHPHILTVYDVGTAERLFIVMELLEGQTLRDLLAAGPLPVRPALELAVQAASGLAKAHGAGIVHRDLKPENVMVTRDGFVKILDFGLAKLAGDDDSPGTAPTASITHTDAVVGTVGYMSPEQARGGPVDFRSDQFAFGAVLYEMLTARRAFYRPTPAATMGAILHDEPEPLSRAAPGVPAELAWVVERCLAKDPDRRYAGTRDLVRDLERLRDAAIRTESGPAASLRLARAPRWRAAAAASAVLVLATLLAWPLATRRSPSAMNTTPAGRLLAVLPFRNLTGAPGDEYFAEGITEAITTDLSRARRLLVISPSSAGAYKGRAVDAMAAGRALGATHLLQGSVQRAADRVRVSARLIDVATGRQVWADLYDRENRDVFALQDDVARSVGAALQVSLGRESGRDPSPPTANLGAYDAYLRGRFHFNRLYTHATAIAAQEGEAARARFEEAVALDPRFAQAHAALGETYASLLFYVEARKEYQVKAYVSIERALALDPDLAEAYAARALLDWTLANGFPHETAANDLRRALELNPNLADARWLLGRVYAHVGLLEASLSQFEITKRLAPDEARNLNRIGMVYNYQGRYEDALAAFAKIPQEDLDDESVSPLLHLGRVEEAKRTAEYCVRRSPDNPLCTSASALVLARAGDVPGTARFAERAIKAARGLSHYHHAEYAIGSAYALIGRKAAAVEWLERAAAHGLPCYPMFRDDVFLAGLKGDPAFEALMSQLKARWERYRRELLPPPA
jgi:eukaryotic-like serine/threonine-protein kinase